MRLYPILIRPDHMEEPSDRPLVPLRLVGFDLPSRRHETRAQQLRQLPRIRGLRCRRTHEVERRQITRCSGKSTQRRQKDAEKEQKTSEHHRRTSFLKKILSL